MKNIKSIFQCILFILLNDVILSQIYKAIQPNYTSQIIQPNPIEPLSAPSVNQEFPLSQAYKNPYLIYTDLNKNSLISSLEQQGNSGINGFSFGKIMIGELPSKPPVVVKNITNEKTNNTEINTTNRSNMDIILNQTNSDNNANHPILFFRKNENDNSNKNGSALILVLLVIYIGIILLILFMNCPQKNKIANIPTEINQDLNDYLLKYSNHEE